MTSFTRKLYALDPAAAEHFQRSQQFETRLKCGKHTTLATFTMTREERVNAYYEGLVEGTHQRLGMAKPRQFGKRQSKGLSACASSCGRAGCRMGCTLSGQFD
jgi:hypothetical protein